MRRVLIRSTRVMNCFGGGLTRQRSFMRPYASLRGIRNVRKHNCDTRVSKTSGEIGISTKDYTR